MCYTSCRKGYATSVLFVYTTYDTRLRTGTDSTCAICPILFGRPRHDLPDVPCGRVYVTTHTRLSARGTREAAAPAPRRSPCEAGRRRAWCVQGGSRRQRRSSTRKETLIPLGSALCVTKRIESAESSMPATFAKCGARVNAKRPAPRYAPPRWVGGGGGVLGGSVGAGGIMASRTYEVRGTRTELLFR